MARQRSDEAIQATAAAAVAAQPLAYWTLDTSQNSGLIRSMSVIDPSGTDWNDREVDLIVADYFEMLGKELSGEPFVKAVRNAALQTLIGRTRGSIERKHQNISAVLRKLGMPWIIGYKPLPNFQRALLNAIEHFLVSNGEVFASGETATNGVAESANPFFEPPPIMTMATAAEPEPLMRLARKFDPAARDARNRLLGKQGEEKILLFERSRLAGAGRADLARKVKWVSESPFENGIAVFSRA